jgi:AcrR family transcriptional regulator
VSKLQRNKAENRARILEAAFRVFAEKGLDNTRISDVVRESGLARGTFYNYFTSVEALWQTLISDFEEMVSQAAHEARIHAPDAESFIRDAFARVFEVFEQNPAALQLLVRNQMAARSSLLTGTGIRHVLELLETDILNSGFFSNLSREQVALASFAMTGAAFEILVQNYERGIPVNARQQATDLANLMLYGMKGMMKGEAAQPVQRKKAAPKRDGLSDSL